MQWKLSGLIVALSAMSAGAQDNGLPADHSFHDDGITLENTFGLTAKLLLPR
ncbi:hypothetical protein [Meridianimarinicoccus sp. MJW13]|uniref:hypothetical protein n=1 Tax=Meridianimarinicoccus sp. MJW13 TaxID=2720031 RepID=UPI001868EDB7|nr:hypothetical protein [Fluviibacterium sp. MJW13]